MKMTVKDLDTISHVMLGEQMAAKKARVYSGTLTDVNLAESMLTLSKQHEARFRALLAILSGGEA